MLLRRGASGPRVEELQRKLRTAGFLPGPIDGVFGPATRAAVVAFQKSEGLLPDGIVGPRTAEELFGPVVEDIWPELDCTDQVTVDLVGAMFPSTPTRNIRENLPYVLEALHEFGLTDKLMVLMALASIRAETESFLPVTEGISQYNTSPGGHPYDLYDNRRDLGNQGPPDGALFCGRGYPQLTGRHNYRVHGQAIGLRLEADPELANDPNVSARLLASFLATNERRIKDALINGELRTARRIYNGGSHGLDRFVDAYQIGDRRIRIDGTHARLATRSQQS